MYQNVDIVIVQKKTHDETHQKTREMLENRLKHFAVTYEILTLDDIRTKKIPYFVPSKQKSGFLPRKKLVISLGGDGTLLHASHYVGGDVRLLGLNSSPKTSKGYLCFLNPDKISSHLAAIIEDKHKFKQAQRLQLFIEQQRESGLPLCLNDILICHPHPAATTRSILTLINQKSGQTEFTHAIYSSGIWVSTVSGQTAAVSSYGFPKDEETDTIFVAVREPYLHKNGTSYPTTFYFRSHEKKLIIESRMPSGLICVDGHDSCSHFSMGDVLTFRTPKEAFLKLVLS